MCIMSLNILLPVITTQGLLGFKPAIFANRYSLFNNYSDSRNIFIFQGVYLSDLILCSAQKNQSLQ